MADEREIMRDPLWEQMLDSLIRGVDRAPLPVGWADLSALGPHTPDDDPATALLERLTLLHYLYEGQSREGDRDDSPALPAEDIRWTPARLRVLRDWLSYPPVWAWPELAGVLRRSDLVFPRAAWQALFDALDRHPDLFPVLADRLDGRAHAYARSFPPYHWLFPVQAPDLRRTAPARSSRQVLHGLWQDPSAALRGLQNMSPPPDTAWWLECLGTFAHRFPPQATALLPLVPEMEMIPLHLRYVRAKLGDEALRRQALEVLLDLIRIEQETLRVALPPPGAGWGGWWSGEEELERSEVLNALCRCLSLRTLAHGLGHTPDTLLHLAFRSPDVEVLLPALAAQLRYHPDPELGLAWWAERLTSSIELAADAEEGLEEGIPQDRLSDLLVRYLAGSREAPDPAGPVGRLLASPSLFWSEALTREVFHLLALRPAMVLAFNTQPSLFSALLWRGHLGVWALQVRHARPLGDLPAALYKRREEILEVVQTRIQLHQSFRAKE